MEEIGDGIEDEALGRGGKREDGAVSLFEGEGFPGAGDDDGLLDGRRSLGAQREGEEEEDEEESHAGWGQIETTNP